MLCFVMLCYFMLCYATSCRVMLCYVMTCYAMLVMLCYAIYVTICRVMLCYVMLCVSKHKQTYEQVRSKKGRVGTSISCEFSNVQTTCACMYV